MDGLISGIQVCAVAVAIHPRGHAAVLAQCGAYLIVPSLDHIHADIDYQIVIQLVAIGIHTIVRINIGKYRWQWLKLRVIIIRRGIVPAIEQIPTTAVHIEIYAVCAVDSVLPDARTFEIDPDSLVCACCLYGSLCPKVVASPIFQPSSQLVFSRNSGIQADIHGQVVVQTVAIGITPVIRTDSTEERRLNNETYRDVERLLIRGDLYRCGIISRFN